MAEEKETPQLEYNYLSANCGLRVSSLALGAMTFGGTHGKQLPGNSDEETSHKIMDRFAECGGNFIDTANTYSFGESEQIVGSWLQKHDREDFVVATKCRFYEQYPSPAPANKPNNEGLSRKNIIRMMEQSLENLKTDYIDLYQIHCPDAGTPIKETLMTLNDLVRCGKVRYVGGCNLLGYQLQKIVDLNEYMGFSQWVTLQQQYNILDRGSEIEAFDVCKNEGLGVLPWSPLKGGLLTGKYSRDTEIPKDSRLGFFAQDKTRKSALIPDVETYIHDEKFLNLVDTMKKAGSAHGKTVAQVALKWLLQKPPVTSVLAGSRTLSQLESNIVAGTKWKLTDEEMAQIEEASKWDLFYPYNFARMQNVGGKRDRFPGQSNFFLGGRTDFVC